MAFCTLPTEHEQLPQHLGWRKPTELFQADDLTRYMELIQNLTQIEQPGTGCPQARSLKNKRTRRSSHFGA